MKAYCFAAIAAVAVIAFPFTAEAQVTHTFSVFKVTATIPVMYVDHNPYPEKTYTKTLHTNDIINLALGQDLGTKLSPDLVLGVACDFESHTDPPVSKLIVFDRSQTGIAQEKVVVAKLNTLVFDNASTLTTNKGFGFGTATVNATTLGDPSKWGFYQTDFSGSALGGGPHARKDSHGVFQVSPVGTGSINGKFKFNITDKNGTTVTFEGICTKGMLRLSGKSMGSYQQTI